jgi:3-oxoadipate enol-lactonase
MPIVQVNGCNIYYETSGKGSDVVFVHSEDHGIEVFEDQISRFADEFRCTTYYRRGHGKSESPPYGYSLWSHTLDLAGLMDHLEIDSAVFVTVGMGNPVAVFYALVHPERVRAIALVSWYELDGYPLAENRRKGVHQLSFADLHLKLDKIQRESGQTGLKQFIEENTDLYWPMFPIEPEPRDRMIRMTSSHPTGHFLQAAEFYASVPNLVPEMHRITCPILGICGQDDPTPDRPELLADLPNFSQAWIDGARRFSLMERPGAFNDVLGAFLTEVGASDS